MLQLKKKKQTNLEGEHNQEDSASGKVKPRIRASVEAKNNAKDTFISLFQLHKYTCMQANIYTQTYRYIYI